MSEYKTRIAIGAILAIVIATGFAFELNNLLPTNSATSTTNNNTSIASPTPVTSSFGNGPPPAICGASPTGTDTSHGYELDVYTSWFVPFGGDVCIYTHLQNVSNQSKSLPTNESLVVEYTLAPGTVYFQSECKPPAYSGSFGPNSTGWNCDATWDTSDGYRNGTSTQPIAYQLSVTIHFANSSTVVLGGSDIYVGQQTTTTSSTTAANSCGSPQFQVKTPVRGGPAYLRVVTSQGATIANGSLLVSHSGSLANGIANSTSYCLALGDANATGYVPIAVNESLSPTGSYDLTVIASSGPGGPLYQVTIPTVVVQQGATVYVTVSVPSGEVNTVTCSNGGCATVTATAAASTEGRG
jgi:hypothetical protein